MGDRVDKLTGFNSTYKKSHVYNPNKYIREMYKHEPRLH